MKFKVTPMTCGSCVATITKLIHKADPSAAVDVDLSQGTVVIEGGPSADQVGSILRGAGYDVEAIQPAVAPAGAAGKGACCGGCHT